MASREICGVGQKRGEVIVIASLTDEDVGREVVYQSHQIEYGRITSWNDVFIFVDYTGNGRGVATRPEDLDFTIIPRTQ